MTRIRIYNPTDKDLPDQARRVLEIMTKEIPINPGYKKFMEARERLKRRQHE